MRRRSFLMGGLALAASSTLLPELQTAAHASPAPAAGPAAAPSQVLSDMQDPRAWALSSRDGSIRPDTSTHSHGNQSLEITTTGDSGRPTSADLALSGVDMTDCQWDLWLRAEDYRQIESIQLELGGEGEDCLRLDVAPDMRTLRTGTWCRVTVNRAAERAVVGHPRLDQVTRVRLKVVPASDSTSSRLWLGYLATLPSAASGIVSISFDDGYDSDYKTARAILQDCGIGAATSYVIADKVGLPGRMSTAQLAEMRERHGWDIAAHASTDLTTLDEAGVRRELETIRSFLLEHGYPEGAAHFALPMGRYNDLVLRTSQDYFTSMRTIENAPETLAPGDPFRLRVFYCGSYTTESQVEKALARCREHRCWTHMVFHRIDEQTDGAPESIRADSFERFMRRVADSGLPVKTVPEVMRSQSPALA
ncbi:polysaccharide deacetylase family protein [Actinomyces oris]|uniref:polysaccharide deacetylase family protein n=1 Tax=Actinomyces oris TaxID=544580 RepID=UPI0022FD3808|nr:polysaccharide deacetylase family protein [Actinomyces oris]WCA43958.1 polysaccharide deacetylase family protein [Actinomyces oris]